jgi:hypothetical protein
MIGTHGSLEKHVLEGEMCIPYPLQLVSKQVYLKGGWILGRDFSKAIRTRIYFRERILSFQYYGSLVRKKLTSLPAPRDGRVNKLTLPARTELIVQVPVDAGPRIQGGLADRDEQMPGVYKAESLAKVNNGRIITSNINAIA